MNPETQEKARERRTQFEMGHEEAVKQCLLVLSMGIDFYPGMPTDETLEMIMNPDEARAICQQLRRFREKIARDIRKGEAAA